MHKIVHAAVFFLILAGTSAAHAQERAYAGFTLGPSKAGVMNGAGQRIEHHNDGIAFKAYAGYPLSEHFAIEGGYAGTSSKPRFDKAQFGAAADPKAGMSAFYAALRGKVAVSASVDLFAKLGVARNRFELAGAGAQDFDVSAVKAMVGVGAAWRLSEKVALTAELEHYGRVREGSRSFVQNRAQVGLQFGF
ncbi:outer membrane beta-barrel protein [Massilia sp. DD77]|uniref:outer membrane beta-barrel protein n=1 Tax=Massilia sp. DD77 TaxID=3109349 RepID=UPI002FFDBE57